MDFSLTGSSIYEILQASILECFAVPSSWGSSRPRDRAHVSYVSCVGRQVLTPRAINCQPSEGIWSIKNYYLVLYLQEKMPPTAEIYKVRVRVFQQLFKSLTCLDFRQILNFLSVPSSNFWSYFCVARRNRISRSKQMGMSFETVQLSPKDVAVIENVSVIQGESGPTDVIK